MDSRTLSFLLLFFHLALVSAQGQLQFSQAIAIEMEGTALNNGNDVVVDTYVAVVPVGKVWKVESVNHGATRNPGSGALPSVNYVMVTLNDVLLVPKSSDINNAQPSISMSPIWLPPGSYTFKLWQASAPQIVKVNALITALEFDTM